MTAVLTDDGRVITWGSNSHGELGTGKEGGTSSAPRLVQGALAGLRVVRLVARASLVLAVTGACENVLKACMNRC